MTELVDTIKVEVTLHHCRDKLMIDPLRRQFAGYWQWILTDLLKPGTEGVKTVNGDKITIRWSHSGLEEIPEESGGDN